MIAKKVKCICAVHRNIDSSQSAAVTYLSKIAVEMTRSRRFYRYFIWLLLKKPMPGAVLFTQYERPGIPRAGAASARYAR